MVDVELRQAIKDAYYLYQDAKRLSSDGQGHDVYLAEQRFRQLASPATITRLILHIEALESELEEYRIAATDPATDDLNNQLDDY